MLYVEVKYIYAEWKSIEDEEEEGSIDSSKKSIDIFSLSFWNFYQANSCDSNVILDKSKVKGITFLYFISRNWFTLSPFFMVEWKLIM